MMRTIAALAVLCLAACSEPQAPAPAPQAEPAAPAPPAADARYVGMWAVDRRVCDTPAWRFEAAEISTLGEVHCDLNEVRETAAGYRIAAMCTAEAPPAPYTLEIAVGDRTMTVSGGPWAGPTNLVHCGPLTDD